MVTNLHMVAHFLNLISNKYYLVQFFAKLWASTANIKGMGVLQTFRQFRNKSKFQHNSYIFSLKYRIKKFVL